MSFFNKVAKSPSPNPTTPTEKPSEVLKKNAEESIASPKKQSNSVSKSPSKTTTIENKNTTKSEINTNNGTQHPKLIRRNRNVVDSDNEDEREIKKTEIKKAIDLDEEDDTPIKPSPKQKKPEEQKTKPITPEKQKPSTSTSTKKNKFVALDSDDDIDMEETKPTKQSPKKKQEKKQEQKNEDKKKEDKPKEDKPKQRWYPGMGDENRKAKNHGCKPIPSGKPGFLNGKLLCITGQLESLDRDEAEEIIKNYGGEVKQNVLKKTDYVVVGENAGKSKMAAIEKWKTKTLSEDDFLELIRKSNPNQINYEQQNDAEEHQRKLERLKQAVASPSKTAPILSPKKAVSKPGESYLWVEKYRPEYKDELIGNNESIDTMVYWLQNWEKHFIKGDTSTEAPSNKSDKRSTLYAEAKKKKAVFISGVPGIGKTTAARIVCKKCNYSPIELNASDTRNKKSLEDTVAEMINNRSITEFFGSKASKDKKVCLIMDEIDGMSGNNDRGGVVEVVNMIKNTKIPIICIANDHSKRNLQTLINHCIDLKFMKPSSTNIIKRVTEICAKEGLKVDQNVISSMVSGLNADIRSILNNLQLLSKSSSNLTYANTKKDNIEKSADQASIFDTYQNAFKQDVFKHYLDDYFYDTELVPAFVQEHYIYMKPSHSDALSMAEFASRDISMGDIVHKKIRSEQSWTLAPVDALFAVLSPGIHMKGNYDRGMHPYHTPYVFPSSLAKLGTLNKNLRLVNQIHKASAMRASANPVDIATDYFPTWKATLYKHLKQDKNEALDSIDEVIQAMDEYDLTREDLETLNDITMFRKDSSNEWKQVDSKVKTALTRQYNKEHKTVSKAKKAKVESSDFVDDEEEGNAAPVVEDSEEDTANTGDAYLTREQQKEKEQAALDEFVKVSKNERKIKDFTKAREKAEKKTTKKSTASSSKKDTSAAKKATPKKESKKKESTASSSSKKRGRAKKEEEEDVIDVDIDEFIDDEEVEEKPKRKKK